MLLFALLFCFPNWRVGGQLRSFQGRLPSAAASAALYEPLEFEESRTFYARKPLVPSGSGRLEGAPVKSSEEVGLSKYPYSLDEYYFNNYAYNNNSFDVYRTFHQF